MLAVTQTLMEFSRETLENATRKQLQSWAKKHGIRANMKSTELVAALWAQARKDSDEVDAAQEEVRIVLWCCHGEGVVHRGASALDFPLFAVRRELVHVCVTVEQSCPSAFLHMLCVARVLTGVRAWWGWRLFVRLLPISPALHRCHTSSWA